MYTLHKYMIHVNEGSTCKNRRKQEEMKYTSIQYLPEVSINPVDPVSIRVEGTGPPSLGRNVLPLPPPPLLIAEDIMEGEGTAVNALQVMSPLS